MIAKKANKKLWDSVRKEVMNGGKWDARKAQRAAKLYKQRGGKYIGTKRPGNSLTQWTKEQWDYVDGGPRYLPVKIIEQLTPNQRRYENRLKREATAAGKKKAPYSKRVRELFKSL